MAGSGSRQLSELERIRGEYGAGRAERKRELLRTLDDVSLRSPREVLRLHETLCFLRAYPDDAALLRRVERMLGRFAERADLRRHAAALEDTGIAGTAIHFRFFLPTASWLARRWGGHLAIDWPELDVPALLEDLVPRLGTFSESPALEELELGLRGWIDRLKGPDETDAAFLYRRLGQLRLDPFVAETLVESFDVPLVLAAGPDTPARGREKLPGSPVRFQEAPLRRSRPSIARELARRPLSVRVLTPREGRRVVDLARGAMVTRARDLDAFAYGNPRDVRMVDCGDGLHMACVGVVPERRFLLESIHGFLMLKNAVPVGYGTYTAMLRSAEVAFTVFATFRGSEAAWMYARVLAVGRHVFGCDAFTIDPYQLGDHNADAVRSGAWWFYRKLGFRPRSPELLRIMRREESRMRRDPGHRSSPATLRKLATESLCLWTGKEREDVVGLFPSANIGLRVTDFLARRFGHDRSRAERECAGEAARRLGVRSLRGWRAGERLAWRRWSPLILILPLVERWSAEDRRRLVELVRAKGGRREADYLRRVDRHRPLQRALHDLARPL